MAVTIEIEKEQKRMMILSEEKANVLDEKQLRVVVADENTVGAAFLNIFEARSDLEKYLSIKLYL